MSNIPIEDRDLLSRTSALDGDIPTATNRTRKCDHCGKPFTVRPGLSPVHCRYCPQHSAENTAAHGTPEWSIKRSHHK